MTLPISQTTHSTLDPPTSCQITIRKEDGRYYVNDIIGVRYGTSSNPLMALIEWWWQVQDLLDIDEPTANPLAAEIARYRQALGA